jgi:hypothetical protein
MIKKVYHINRVFHPAHAQRLERWLGAELVEKIHLTAYYWPVPLLNVPGCNFIYRGDVLGSIRGGGFASLSDLISEATTGGKLQIVHFTKAGTTGVAGVMNSLARVGSNPPGVATAAAFAAGETCTDTSPSGLGIGFDNAGGGDTLHLTTAYACASVASQLLLLYDRLYHGNWNIATATQSVTGVSTRYTDTTSKGSFVSAEVSTALGATTYAITITYTDQDGNTGHLTSPALAISSAAIVNRFPHATPYWHYPLAAGDTGVRQITQCAIATATTGNLNVFIGHPLAWIPTPAQAYTPVILDGINSAFNLTRIFDDSCLCLLELFKSATSSTNWTGAFYLVSG